MQMTASVSRPEHGPPHSGGGRRRIRATLVGAAVLTWLALLPGLPAARAQDAGIMGAWPNTDFSRVSADLSEVMSGGPPRDGIPAILDPTFLPAAEETRIDDREPVMTYDPGAFRPDGRWMLGK